jgi:Domain of unknown function (DUF4604)
MGFLLLYIDSEEPAFLRRLRGEVGESAEKHSHPIARPRAKRPAGDEDEDAPTYVVDASTNETLSKADIEHLKGNSTKQDDTTAGGASEPTTHTTDDSKPETESKKENVGQIGGASKRRIAKVVGAGPEDQDVPSKEKLKKRKKIEKKAKVKLSFDED